MQGRGEVVAVERNRAPRRGAGAHRAAAARRQRQRRGRRRRALVAGAPGPQTPSFDRVLVDPPCSGLGTLQARADLRWRVTPDAIAAMARAQARILDAGARALRPGGVLVYSTCTISPAENERLIAAFLDSHPDFGLDDCRRCGLHVGRCAGAADAAPPRPHRRLLHRPHAQELSDGGRMPRRRPGPPIDLGPQCPHCGEPWLRPTNLPGRYRCVYCLHRFELTSVCPNCGEHSTIVQDVLDGDAEVQQLRRLDAAGRMSRTPRSSARTERASVRVRPSILSADFGRLREQVAGGAGRRARGVIHVDVMDGHFVPPITVGPLIVAALAEDGPRRRRDARGAPDDRAPRAPAATTSSAPGPTRSRSTPRRRHTSPTRPT